MSSADWEQRLADFWASIDDHHEEELHTRMEALVSELPADDPVALYERGSAFDSTGHSGRAVPLYREALEGGLGADRRRQAVIQLASSLRNLGEAAESVALLSAERDAGSNDLDDAVDAFLALALVDARREREAVSVALLALARHMTRYQRSLVSYARELAEQP